MHSREGQSIGWVARVRENAVAIFVAAILGVVWWFPQFPTTDGPSHVYNAEIVRQHIVGEGPQVSFFTVSTRPLPNWTGHTLLVIFLTVFSPMTAERLMITVYFLVWAAALRFYLRSTENDGGTAGVLGMICSINLPLMMGFYNFGFGVVGYLVTLALACKGHPRSWPQALLLAAVLTATYFSHPLPLVASLCATAWLWWLRPPSRPRADLGKLIVSALPAIALAAWYFFAARESASAAQFSQRVASVTRTSFNWEALQCLWYGATLQRWIAVAAVATWALLLAGAAWSRSRERPTFPARDWSIIAISVAAILASILVPKRFDNLFVASRLSLLGLVTGLGVVRAPGAARRIAGVVVAFLAVMTVVTLTDYERRSNVERAAYLTAQEFIGEGRWIASLVNWRPPFRVDTMSHAEGYFAAIGNQIDMSNYEGELNYFAVDFHPSVRRPRFYGKPLESADYVDVARKVDALLVWGASPNALIEQGAFRKPFECGPAQVFLSNLRVPENDTGVRLPERCPAEGGAQARSDASKRRGVSDAPKIRLDSTTKVRSTTRDARMAG